MAVKFQNGKFIEVFPPEIKGKEAKKVLSLKPKKLRKKIKFKVTYVWIYIF